jgi:predicted aspartyl protease
MAGCSASPGRQETDPRNSEEWKLYQAKDYFALRERLTTSASSPGERFFLAAVHHAFNDPLASNASVDALLAEGARGDGLVVELWEMKLSNHLRLGQYREALEAADLLLSLGRHGEVDVEDASNTRKLLRALADVPAQEVRVRGPTTLRLDASGHIPLEIEGSSRRYTFDTGANFSALMRSEAEALGLRVRAAGVEVGTATGKKVLADVAVANRAAIGNIDYRNVVFLVLPDEALTFPEDDFRIPGLVGFPLIEAMGEVRFVSGDLIEIPAEPPTRSLVNLALEELEPLLRVHFEGEPLVCRFDTGAGETTFYEPFFRRRRGWVQERGAEQLAKTGGVGGMREIHAYLLPRLVLEVAGERISLSDVDVYTESIVEEDENYLDCNVGQDLLEPFSSYTINFRHMSLVLER